MDYFSVGGRPFFLRFPPYIPGNFNASRYGNAGQQEEASRNIGASTGGAATANDSKGESSPTEASASGAWPSSGPSSSANNLGASDAAFQQAQNRGGATSPAAIGGLTSEAAGSRSPTSRAAEGGTSPAASQFTWRPEVKASSALHTGFDPAEVATWEPSRFEMVRKLQDATRNRGQVHLMRDHENGSCYVAVKQMPNRWIMSNHLEFVREHPTETEMPWQDVGCVRFLSGVGFPFSCGLLGVYRDEAYTYVVTTFASEGDLFLWCEDSVPPGKEREVVVRPLARQIVEGVQQLHDLSIVHRDLSLENILLNKDDDGDLKVRIIDFSMASLTRRLKSSVRGKASYQAPELHTDQEYDAFLTDAFSVGVTLYAMLVKDYPWLSTRPGGCKCFEYVRKHGFRAYLEKRKLRNSTAKVADIMSEPLKQLLEGLLHFDPASRLTLGEHDWENGRKRSVWDVAWLHTGPGEG